MARGSSKPSRTIDYKQLDFYNTNFTLFLQKIATLVVPVPVAVPLYESELSTSTRTHIHIGLFNFVA